MDEPTHPGGQGDGNDVPASLEQELLLLIEELGAECAALVASQVQAAAILEESQRKAAGILKSAEMESLEVLRSRQSAAYEHLTFPHDRLAAVAGFDEAALGLREVHTIAASILMTGQREAALVLLAASQSVAGSQLPPQARM